MGGFGFSLACAGLARLGPSKGWDIAAVAGGALLVLFAIGWPQRLASSAIRAFDAHVRQAHQEKDAAAASRLLFAAGEGLSLLPTRNSPERSGWGFLSALTGLLQSGAVVTYKRQQRATTVYAIEAGLGAGAKDKGALQLAQSPQSNADLLALEAELFKMALELNPHSA